MAKSPRKNSFQSAYASGSKGSLLTWLGLALIILLADQFTKVLITGYYQLGDSTPVASFFQRCSGAQPRGRRSRFWPTPVAGSAGFSQE